MTGNFQMRPILRANSLLAAVISAAALAATPRLCTSAPAQSSSAGARADSASAAVTRIIFLGTNGGPSANPQRAEPANLVVVDGVPYLIDAGPGVGRQIALAGFKLTGIRTIFITHHHIDHDGGLPSLMSMTWFDAAWDDHNLPPVQLYGPPATRFLARTALQAHDIDDNGEFYHDGRITVSAAENSHYSFRSGSEATGQDMSFSYRFDTHNGSVVFTGDTGPSQAVTELARNADVLVSEVCLCDSRAQVHPTKTSAAATQAAAALEKEENFHMSHEHLTPQEVGKLAATAHVKVVILTHFVPGDGKTDPAQFTAGVMKYFPGPVIPARDLFEYDLR